MKSLHYIDRYINADDELISDREARRVVNLRFGKMGKWENIKSHLLKTNTYLPGTGDNICIGQAVDEANRYIIFFNYNSGGAHGIYMYYEPSNTFYKVLLNSNINPGLTNIGLEFSKDYLITAHIVNGNLCFNDNLNQPRKINIGACIKGNHGGASPIESDYSFTYPIQETEITLIKQPPIYAAQISKGTDSAIDHNLTGDQSFQFAFQYGYYDGEESTLSVLSYPSYLNTESEDFNKIVVLMNHSETTPQSVRFIRLWAINDVDGTGQPVAKKIREWDKENAADAALITAHQSSTVTGNVLSCQFYNDIGGELLDAATLVKPYDSVPLLSKDICVADGRIFLANNLSGYDAPKVTSLTASLGSTINPTTSSQVFPLYAAYHGDSGGTITFEYLSYWVYISGSVALSTGFYEIISTAQTNIPHPFIGTVLGAAPATTSMSDLRFLGVDQASAIAATTPGGQINNYQTITATGGNITITGISSTSYKIFKSGTTIPLAIWFYDQYMRKCGAVLSDNARVAIPARSFALTSAYWYINWTLDTTSLTDQIPDWAYYYSVGIPKNLRTRNWVQGFTKVAKYRNESGGTETFADTFSVTDTTEIALPLKSLTNAGLGYSFTEGDVCILTKSGGGSWTLPIHGISGDYVLIKPQDIGSLATINFIYELYTPYQSSDQEPYYENGDIYNIVSPTENTRTWGTNAGSVLADSFAISRNFDSVTYLAEVSCPNDKYYTRWDTNTGRGTLVTSLGQARKKTEICFSNTFIPGTNNNGMSSFEALNFSILPLDLGEIQKILLTSKAEGEGGVMLAIGTNQTASVYIGETQVMNADSTSYFIKSEGVISQVNILRGDAGTQNPESVVLHQGNVYWVDIIKGKFIQYSANGLDSISDGEFKFSTDAKKLCDQFLVNSVGSRAFIFGGVDPYHDEIYWTFPLSAGNPEGTLTDYRGVSPSTIPSYCEPYELPAGISDVYDWRVQYPFNTADGSAKTVVFKKGVRWQGETTWEPEMFSSLGSSCYSFKDGNLYKHGAGTTYGNFYGTATRAKMIFTCGTENLIKEFLGLMVESSEVPEWVYLYSNYPFTQSSDLTATDFRSYEGVFRADILRDRFSPNTSGSYDEKQMFGDKMRSKNLFILIQFNSTSAVWFKTAGVIYNQSTGQF